MKKIFTRLSLLAISIIISTGVMAQFAYTFSQSTTTYVPVTGGTNAFNYVWDDDEHLVPIGFNFNYFGKTYTNLVLHSNGLLIFDVDINLTPLSDTIRTIAVFGDYGMSGQGADLMDRGDNIGEPQSPVVYNTLGTAPNRVLVIEWQNAGFYPDNNLTSYVNVQARLYESTHHIDIVVGTNSIDPNHYQPGSSGPIIGVSAWNVITTAMIGGLYLSGSATSAQPMPTYVELNSTPPSGTLYSFVPSSTNVDEISSSNMHVYPNPVADHLYLHIPSEADLKMIHITDINGRLHISYAKDSHNGNLKIDVSSLPGGVYVIHTDGKNSSGRTKFIKF
jgi:hypothetical protein